MSELCPHTGPPMAEGAQRCTRRRVDRPHAGAFGAIAAAVVVLAARLAAAQAPPGGPPAPPLTQVKDDKQLAELAQAIAQDPEIAVGDPAVRSLAQALIVEGVKQLHARAFDQALANFLDAYARLPNPKLLISIAAILRDMGRLADAANTYRRYLVDPAASAERAGDIEELLAQLDEQLTILTVRAPRGAAVSVDGGPFVTIGGTLVTRVPAGVHRIQVRVDHTTSELKVAGREGEAKDVISGAQPSARGSEAGASDGPPERIDGWLIAGTHYGADSATDRVRKVYDSADGHEIVALAPRGDAFEPGDRGEPGEADRAPGLEFGAVGVVRFDGKGRGAAGGAGAVISRGRLEAELLLLKSAEFGGYLGLRYELLDGAVRPYLALGMPAFAFHHDELQADATMMGTRRLAIGARLAAGVSIAITDHLSVRADLGYEHFFFLDDHQYEADVFVPELGVVGRL